MSDDDWRARIEISGDGALRRLVDHLRGDDIAEQARTLAPAGAIISEDGDVLFAYAASQSDVAATASLIADAARSNGLEAGTPQIERWHPIAEEWEPASEPLPQSQAEVQEERDELGDEERAESRAAGIPEWEVDVTTPSRAEAIALSGRLEEAAIPHHRTSSWLLVPAASEEDANDLAARIEPLLGPGSGVSGPRGSEAEMYLRTHPLAFLGGLAN